MIELDIQAEWLYIANERQKIFKSARKTYNKNSLFDTKRDDIVGTLGEIAVRHYYISKGAKCSQLDVKPEMKGDAGFDLIIDGIKVDVKTNRVRQPNPNYKFMMPVARVKPDKKIMAVLVNETEGKIWILGAIDSNEVIKKEFKHKGEVKGNFTYKCDTYLVSYNEFIQ